MTDDASRLFACFAEGLAADDPLAALHAGEIGRGVPVDGPFGARPLLHADHIASGRAFAQVEDFLRDRVLPFYANSHTEASYCGGLMTRLRRAAREIVRQACGAGPEHAVIFCGSGATAGLNRLVHLFGLDDARGGRAQGAMRPLVLLGPYEHHSNILPWRESGAEVVHVAEGAQGGPDIGAIAALLAAREPGRPAIGAFSAASNITGVLSDVAAVTRAVKSGGAMAVWDYACAGPYVPITMQPAPGVAIDAVALSPHKFAGGPGASGVLVVRRDAVRAQRPTWPGGGTVRFVSDEAHSYSGDVELREEAGTPDVLGDIRAALAFLVKAAAGTGRIADRHARLVRRAREGWAGVAGLELLGRADLPQLPVFSFRVSDGAGGHIHPQLATRMLSDLHGVQARGGCACAGPYALALLGHDAAAARMLHRAILSGAELEKPGFVRLNFSYLLDDAEADRIITAVRDLVRQAPRLRDRYSADPARAIFTPRSLPHPAAPA